MILIIRFHHPPARPLRKRVGAYDREYPYSHAVGGANGSIMVGMFVCLCLTSKKPSEREFIVPAGTDLGVKLLKSQTNQSH